MKRLSLSVVTFLLLVGTAYAEGGLTLTKEVFHEVEIKAEDGRVTKKIVPATTIIPGTEVLFVINYKNQGAKPAENIVITNPVPKEMEYMTASTTPSVAHLKVSVDDGKIYDDLSRLDIKGADGKMRPARASDVNQVRWTLKSDIPSGEGGNVSFRARLK